MSTALSVFVSVQPTKLFVSLYQSGLNPKMGVVWTGSKPFLPETESQLSYWFILSYLILQLTGSVIWSSRSSAYRPTQNSISLLGIPWRWVMVLTFMARGWIISANDSSDGRQPQWVPWGIGKYLEYWLIVAKCCEFFFVWILRWSHLVLVSW